jgi:hypothetical protein
MEKDRRNLLVIKTQNPNITELLFLKFTLVVLPTYGTIF